MALAFVALHLPEPLVYERELLCELCIMLGQTRWCSSANTLRIQRLEFGREQLTKGPDVIRQACRHRWRALPPSGTHRAVALALVQRHLLPQAHVRSGHIVEGLEEDHPLPQARAVFAEAGRLAHQRRQGLPQRQVDSFDKAVLTVRPREVRRSAPSTTRGLSVSSVPC